MTIFIKADQVLPSQIIGKVIAVASSGDLGVLVSSPPCNSIELAILEDNHTLFPPNI